MNYRFILDLFTHVFVLYTGMKFLCVFALQKTGKTQGYGAGFLRAETRRDGKLQV